MGSGIYAQRAQGSRVNPDNQRSHSPGWIWADSLISAMFFYLDEAGEPQQSLFAMPSGGVQLLLFVQDYPVICRPFSFYAGTPDVPHEANPCFPEMACISEGNHFGAGNLLYTTTQPAPTLYKCGVYCETLTNQIPTSGYPLTMTLIPHGLEFEGEPMDPFVQLDVVTNAAVPAGRCNYMYMHDRVASIVYPAILRESDYTEAMARAKNTYTYSIGGYDTLLHIVGIYAEAQGVQA